MPELMERADDSHLQAGQPADAFPLAGGHEAHGHLPSHEACCDDPNHHHHGHSVDSMEHPDGCRCPAHDSSEVSASIDSGSCAHGRCGHAEHTHSSVHEAIDSHRHDHGSHGFHAHLDKPRTQPVADHEHAHGQPDTVAATHGHSDHRVPQERRPNTQVLRHDQPEAVSAMQTVALEAAATDRTGRLPESDARPDQTEHPADDSVRKPAVFQRPAEAHSETGGRNEPVEPLAAAAGPSSATPSVNPEQTVDTLPQPDREITAETSRRAGEPASAWLDQAAVQPATEVRPTTRMNRTSFEVLDGNQPTEDAGENEGTLAVELLSGQAATQVGDQVQGVEATPADSAQEAADIGALAASESDLPDEPPLDASLFREPAVRSEQPISPNSPESTQLNLAEAPVVVDIDSLVADDQPRPDQPVVSPYQEQSTTGQIGYSEPTATNLVPISPLAMGETSHLRPDVEHISPDRLIELGHFLAPAERLELLKYASSHGSDSAFGMLEHLFEQTTAGAFQELIGRSRQIQASAGQSISRLGRLALTILQGPSGWRSTVVATSA